MRTSPGRQFDFPLQRFRLPGIILTLEPQHVKKATICFKDELFTQMEELASLRVKPQLVGAPSPVHPMEGYISCLVQSLQPKHISRMQGPDSFQQHCQTLEYHCGAFLPWAQWPGCP